MTGRLCAAAVIAILAMGACTIGDRAVIHLEDGTDVQCRAARSADDGRTYECDGHTTYPAASVQYVEWL